MIIRIWRGWTTHSNAAAYEGLLLTEIFKGIASRNIPGYQGISLCKREVEDETEFMTIMQFDSLDAVRVFAGERYEEAVVPPRARQLLSRFDVRSAHYEKVALSPSIL